MMPYMLAPFLMENGARKYLFPLGIKLRVVFKCRAVDVIVVVWAINFLFDSRMISKPVKTSEDGDEHK